MTVAASPGESRCRPVIAHRETFASLPTWPPAPAETLAAPRAFTSGALGWIIADGLGRFEVSTRRAEVSKSMTGPPR